MSRKCQKKKKTEKQKNEKQTKNFVIVQRAHTYHICTYAWWSGLLHMRQKNLLTHFQIHYFIFNFNFIICNAFCLCVKIIQ